MKLQRYSNNPILTANLHNEWESLCVCNPAVWYEDGVFTMLYRAAGNDNAHRIHLGLATSTDGFTFVRQSTHPVLSPTEGNYDSGCIEDPRIVKLGDTYYVTYACRPFAPGRYWEFPPTNQPLCPGTELWGFDNNLTFTALAATKDFRTFRKMGRMTKAGMDDRDVLLFPEKIGGRYVRLSRAKEWTGEVYGCEYPSIWLAYSENLLEWPDVGQCYLLATSREWWEQKLGASAPPIYTDRGWFMLYHAVDEKGTYRVGAMILDLEHPERVIGRTRSPILEPEETYETQGYYNGCVFPTGNVVKDGILYVYYGGADQYCCVATADFDALVEDVLRNL